MAEWAVLNAVTEGDDGASPEFPWYPCLFADGISASLEISFATEAECTEFIRTYVMPAKGA